MQKMSSSIPNKPPCCIVQPHDATIGDELTVSIKASLNVRHAVDHINETQAAVLAAVKRPVTTGHVNIDRNQDGGDE